MNRHAPTPIRLAAPHKKFLYCVFSLLWLALTGYALYYFASEENKTGCRCCTGVWG